MPAVYGADQRRQETEAGPTSRDSGRRNNPLTCSNANWKTSCLFTWKDEVPPAAAQLLGIAIRNA